MKYDILCVFGRGIEKVNGTWQPTQYVERLSEANGHPGIRAEGITPFDDDPRVVIAGGEVNAEATALLYAELVDAENPPAIITFAAGRPKYLEAEPEEISEGSVMHRRFQEVIHSHGGTEIVFQSNNRNTRDDLAETLAMAKQRRFEDIGIISVQVHLPRCMEFMKHVDPELLDGIKVHWFASEHIVLRHSLSLYPDLYEAMISPAYVRTAERERKGIEDLRAGRYDFGSQGYAFAPTKS